ncbi:MAG TPA: DUF1826 domain-containing protein [Cyclobacteriaceae bacterium]
MNLLEKIPLLKKVGLKSPKQIVSNYWDERAIILEPNVNLFCWQRPIDLTISNYLRKILKRKPENIRLYIRNNNLKDKVLESRALWESNFDSEGKSFWQDVIQLTRDFILFSDREEVTLHLKIIDNDACSKFHIDGYSLRLFTTYLGAGTQWLPEKATNRRGLGKSNERVIRNVNQIQQMGAFEVGILKGEIPNQQNQTRGIVHRSPPVSIPEEKRLILRIDI